MLARLSKKYREKSMTNIRNEKGHINADSTDIKIKWYYKQLFANKFENFDEMEKIPKKTTNQNLNKIKILNSLISIFKNWIHTETFSQKKTPVTDCPSDVFQTLGKSQYQSYKISMYLIMVLWELNYVILWIF